jgi:hypothetical protein
MELLSRVFDNLLRKIDFLGYQLSHANGLIDDAALEEIATEYMKTETFTDDEILGQIGELFSYLGKDRINTNDLATALNVDFNAINRVMFSVPDNISKEIEQRHRDSIERFMHFQYMKEVDDDRTRIAFERGGSISQGKADDNGE